MAGDRLCTGGVVPGNDPLFCFFRSPSTTQLRTGPAIRSLDTTAKKLIKGLAAFFLRGSFLLHFKFYLPVPTDRKTTPLSSSGFRFA